MQLKNSTIESELANLMAENAQLAREIEVFKRILEEEFEAREGKPCEVEVIDDTICYQPLLPFDRV